MTDYTKLVKALRCNALSKQCDSCKYGYHLCPDSECNDACNVEQVYADAAAAIEALQAQLPKRGEWVARTDVAPFKPDGEITSWTYRCSECGKLERIKQNYCPYCGAKMEVQDDD